MFTVDHDVYFMKKALEQASKAKSWGDVPVGAALVQTHDFETGKVLAKPQLISYGSNQREVKNDPTAHAEVIALRKGAKKLGRWRLTDCTLYVTLEPCFMCAGAAVLARLNSVVFGALDPKGGAVYSVYSTFEEKKLNHSPKVRAQILEEECSDLLKDFFKQRRIKGHGA